VLERPKAHGSSYSQSATTILWTKLPQKADCALWVLTQTVHNNNLMDHFDPKSWLCPKGHHTSSPQQGFDGPFWHRQGWLCQKDLWPVDHHTDSPQQQSNGGMWRRQLTVPCGSSYKQSTTTIWWTILTYTVLTVLERPKAHGSSYSQSATTILWTKLPQKADCAVWVMTQTVHNNYLMEQLEWKSWLCPVGQRTNSSQQQ